MASSAMNKAVGEVGKVIKIGLKSVGKETKAVLQGKINPKQAVGKVVEDVDREATQAITEDSINSVFPSESPFSEKSDKEGITLGEFITSNAEVALRLKEAQAKLKEIVGDCPEVDIIFFKNWAKTVKGMLLHVSPKRVEQVQTIVRAAAELKIKVGCGGAYSSWSPIFPDGSDGQQSLIINTYELVLEDGVKRIRLNDAAEGKKTVTIASGVTTAELKQFLLDNDICLHTSVMAQSLTYGGILSTASHGTGKDNPIPSDYITSLKLVDGNGDIRTYPDDIPAELPQGISQEDAMNAVRASLGVFGIVVEFTLKVEESFSVRVDNTFPTISQLFYGPHPKLEEVVKNNWAVEIHWFPFSSLGTVGGLVQALPVLNVWNPKADEVWLRTMNPVQEEAPINKWQVFMTQVNDTLEGHALNATRGVVSQHSFLMPAVIGTVLKQIKGKHSETTIERLPYAIHYRFGVKFAPLYDMEFAFPCNLDDLSPVYKALDIVLKKTERRAIQDLGLHKKYPLSIGIELRVFGKSSCLLSPSAPGEKSHTACIDLIGLAGVPAHLKFFDEVAEEWLKLGGIPHWAKQWTTIPGIMDHIRAAYGENLVKFAKVRKALGVDKDDMFLNKTMREVLSPV